MIKKHYLDLKSVEEADRFWQIVPKGCHLPPMEKIREEGKFILKEDEGGHMRAM